MRSTRTDPFHPRIAAAGVLCALMALALGCKGGGDLRVTVDVSGGAGTVAAGSRGPIPGNGGEAGRIDILIHEPGTADDGIEIVPDGRADAGFEPASPPPLSLGPNPFMVTDFAFVFAPTVAPPAEGFLYVEGGVGPLFVSDGDEDMGDEEAVSSLVIEPGAELQVQHHVQPEVDRIEIVLSHDLSNEGVIVTQNVIGSSRGNVRFEMENGRYVGAGDIFSHGLEAGQDGGAISIRAGRPSIIDGRILAFGFGSDARGGTFEFVASAAGTGPDEVSLELAGEIDVRGGDGDGAGKEGGQGGVVFIVVPADLLISGDVDASGGSGTDSGGRGGPILLSADVNGDLLCTGDVRAAGGTSGAGSGGTGGSVQLTVDGGALRSSGVIDVSGGVGAEEEVHGANGGLIRFVVEETADSDGFDPELAGGNIASSGRLLARGSDGFPGGAGGEISIELHNSDSGHGAVQKISLLGQGRWDGSGGDGREGGEGASLLVSTNMGNGPGQSAIVIRTPIDLSGGDADPDEPGTQGGDGGPFFSIGTPFTADPEPDQSGGTGATPGEAPLS